MECPEEIEPLLNGGRIVLLAHPNLESQLLGLVRRGEQDRPSETVSTTITRTERPGLYLASKNQVFNPRALPIGVGRGIGCESGKRVLAAMIAARSTDRQG